MLSYIQRVSAAKYICPNCEKADESIILAIEKRSSKGALNGRVDNDTSQDSIVPLITNMEKQIVQCIKSFYSQQNDVTVNKEQLNSTITNLRQENKILKDNIQMAKTEMRLKESETELRIKEQQLITKSIEQEARQCRGFQQMADETNARLRREIECSHTELENAKKEIVKLHDENLSMKLQWQTNQTENGKWRVAGKSYRDAAASNDRNHSVRSKFASTPSHQEETSLNSPSPSDDIVNVPPQYDSMTPSPSRIPPPTTEQRRENRHRPTAFNRGLNAPPPSRFAEYDSRRDNDSLNTLDNEQPAETNQNKRVINEQSKQSNEQNDRDKKNNRSEYRQKNVLLIGNSQINAIDPVKFSRQVHLQKIVKYTIDEVEEWLRSGEYQCFEDIDVVIVHEITNDVKNSLAIHCAKRMVRLVDNIAYHFKGAKIVVSLGTPRDDNAVFNERVSVVNTIVRNEFKFEKSVRLVHHQNLLEKGSINEGLYKYDRYHLNEKGTRVLAANLRHAVERNYAAMKHMRINRY